jgi:hypothetical protein
MPVPAPAHVTAIGSGQREWEDREWFPPGPQLAVCLSGGNNRLADLTDDELLQVAAAARRQTSWAQARELAAIAELTRRRTTDEESGDPDYRILSARESVTEEVSAALTVTGNAAATLVHLAEQLTGPLTRTGHALEAGRIDLAKARVIVDITDHLPEQTARRVEDAALEKAAGQTTGQLRRRIKPIAQRLAPEAVEERKRQAVRQRRLELWDTPSGTTDLALADLRPEDAHAIYNKITAAAHGIKTDGDTRPLNAIRADLATQLLHGTELPDAVRALLTQTGTDAHPTPSTTCASPHRDRSPSKTRPDDAAWASLTAHRSNRQGGGSRVAETIHSSEMRDGRVHLLGGAAAKTAGSECGGGGQAALVEGGRFGGAVDVWALADVVGQRLAHVSGRVSAPELPGAIRRAAQRIHRELTQDRETACRGDGDTHGRPPYRPPMALRQQIEARHGPCVFPTCNQPSHRCDLDHTIPWRPGTTCRCNLAPLCRRHHRLKQRTDWMLLQLWPGLLIWVTPAGAWYIVRPDRQ